MKTSINFVGCNKVFDEAIDSQLYYRAGSLVDHLMAEIISFLLITS